MSPEEKEQWRMDMVVNNHYRWLEEWLEPFFIKIGLNKGQHQGMDRAHGDKAYSYQDKWAEHGIPFQHGVAIYLASYCKPFSDEVRNTKAGPWVAPDAWVIANYERFKPHLEPMETWYNKHGVPTPDVKEELRKKYFKMKEIS
jgi:hypothetical protein